MESAHTLHPMPQHVTHTRHRRMESAHTHGVDIMLSAYNTYSIVRQAFSVPKLNTYFRCFGTLCTLRASVRSLNAS